MRFFTFAIGLLIGFASLAFVPSESFAQNTATTRITCVPFLPGCGNVQISTGDYQKSPIIKIIERVISWIITIAASGAIMMGVIAGVMFVLSGGNEEMRSRATRTFIFAGAGLLLAMFAYFIVAVINMLPFPGT